jgi:prepilin-type N-terminal cleavage/methylation domain-containing protein
MMNHIKLKRKHNQGLTLIELLAVIVILGIISSIAFVTYQARIQKARIEVCETNRIYLEKAYDRYLFYEHAEHSNDIFTVFLDIHEKTKCPEDGEFIYKNGRILCNKHSQIDNNDQNEPDLNPVPFL